jgi:SAM-dependent methyltransferase
MENIYINGEYYKRHPTWDVEDSSWKAGHIHRLIERNHISGSRIADVGCGAGGVLFELSRLMKPGIRFYGYDISPQAIELAGRQENVNICFKIEDLLSDNNNNYFDILLIIDVVEHIPDYMDFLKKCRTKANYKIFHIPLDLSVTSVLNDSFIEGRRNLGHVHYFSFQSAMACLKDTGHVIIDCVYTDVGTYYRDQVPNPKNIIANLPRRILAFFSVPLAAKLLGRYSILVLTR